MLKLRRQDQGVTLLTALVIFIIVGGIAVAFFTLSLNEAKSTESIRFKTRATYLAEAGAEIAANVLRQSIANNPSIMSDPSVGGTAFNALVVNQVVKIDGFPVQCKAIKRQIINIATSASSLHISRASFEIMGYASVGGDPNKPKDRQSQQSIVYKMVETTGTPLFQFLAFYNGDMEVNPGPYAHFHGRMHTNADMYLTDRDAKGMVLDTDHVQAVGDMYRTYSSKNSGGGFAATAVETGATGDVWIRQTGTTPLSDSAIDASPGSDPGLIKWDLSLNSKSSGFPTTAQSDWNGTVLDGAMGAQTMVPPQIQSVQPGGYYDTQAATSGLTIRDGKAYQGSTDVTANINIAQPGTITTSSIYDAREQKTVSLVSVDVGKLMQTSYRPSNGILYATDSTASASNPVGLQLTNGSYIPPASSGTSGFTVASNLPVYVKGDYNGGTNPTTGLSLSRTDTSVNPPITYPQTLNAAGTKVDTQPCAIMADAVNLLSNSWDNSKGPSSSPPSATNTTYNAAIVSGNQATAADPTSPDNGYNGGLQNLPRFHENWGGIKCNIAGSFVNLWRSTIATGVYGKGNVYSPPERHWDFDPHFDKPNGNPPGSPFAISIGRTTYEEGAVRAPNYDLQPN